MILEIAVLLLTVLFIYNWWAHGYWKRRKVFSLPTEFLFGNTRKLILGQALLPTMLDGIYKKYKKERMVGFYCFHNPMLFVTDPEIIKKVLVTEFHNFNDNGFTLSKHVDPIFGLNPFVMKGIPLWKEMRSIQSLNQTPLKLRDVVPNLVKIGESMYEFIKDHKNQPIPVLDLTTRTSVDSAVVSAFGIEPKSFKDKEFGFIKYASGDKLFHPSKFSIIASLFLPLLNKFQNLRIISTETEDFFISVAKSIFYHRRSSKLTRGDLVDIILKLNNRKLEQNNEGYTDQEMAAHCATFYLDATLTSGMVASFFMLELAKHQDVQDRLRSEILSVGTKPEDFDYDKIKSFTYLQMVLDETLRIHSPLSFVSRSCTNDTVIEGVKISKGTKVFISAMSLHNDPEYFPDPEKFDPERFSETNKKSLTKYTFMPFGEGPRICVGMRYGTMFVKTLIVLILLKYKILPSGDQTESLHDYDTFLLAIKPGAAVKLEEL